MRSLLLEYAQYNVWANQQFLKLLEACTPEQVTQKIVSSFPTLKDTVYHMWSAEDVWNQRLRRVERPVWQAGIFAGNFEEALNNWRQASKKLLEFVEEKTDEDVNDAIEYADLLDRPYSLPIYAGLMQVLNHATYHRGQLVTMLRQVGFTEIPQTDFHFYKMTQ